MKRLIDKIIIRLFWSRTFKQIRMQHYHMAYDQGKFDEYVERTYGTESYELMEGTYEN